MSYTKDERDDFWDIEKLVPKKKSAVSPFLSNRQTVNYEIAGDAEKNTSERSLSFDSVKGVRETEDRTYLVKRDGLIKRVTIKRFIDKYDFYGSFRKAALIYFDYKTEKCDFASFYSYLPQYSQLTSEQKNYYFYWRNMLREGKYLPSDYSYLYLYVYEILNLPDKIPPEEGIRLLVSVWKHYRGALPRIDSYFSLWIQDYCLIYDLQCPMDELSDFIFEAISASDFKEFYLSDIEKSGEGGVEAMIAYLSDYDWHKGKYAGGENSALYASYMKSAMWRFLHRLDLGRERAETVTTVLKRDAFAHSLCTHAVKCKLEVEYIPLSGNDRIRALVTSGVRYTENKIRALFGIKSRLAVKDLPDEYKRIIDLYFDNIFEKERIKNAAENIPEYEKLYDAPKTELSFEGADEIERASWITTMRLVENEEEEPTDREEEKIAEPALVPEGEGSDAPNYGLSPDEIKAVGRVLSGEAITDSLAERINEAFADGFGDVILEFDGEKYKVIEDYEEEIAEWLLKITK